MQLRGEPRSLRSEYIRYIIPSILAQWVYTLYTAVDGLFVAKGVSVTAMTAINIASPFVTALFALSLMFAVGTSVPGGHQSHPALCDEIHRNHRSFCGGIYRVLFL